MWCAFVFVVVCVGLVLLCVFVLFGVVAGVVLCWFVGGCCWVWFVLDWGGLGWL